MWREAKSMLKKINGTSDEMLPRHLDEFMWRQLRGKTGEESFSSILTDISEWFIVE